MVAATLAQAAIAQRRQMQREQLRAQAFWLVESGIDRAAAALGRDPMYAGEEWQVAVPAAFEPQPGLVAIRVTAVDNRADKRRVEVTAEFPTGEVHRATLRRHLTVTLH